MINNIADRALLIAPVIHVFYNSRSDAKMLSEAVTTIPGMCQDDAVMRSLLPTEEFKAVNKAKQRIRKVITDHTFPWSENGRILPAADVFAFHEALNEATAEFDAAADDLTSRYEQLREDMKQRRGDWFNPLEYPETEAAFRDRFRVDLNITPFPNVDDFRLQISEDLVETIRDQIQDGWKSNIDNLRLEWVNTMHKLAISWMEVPTDRRLNALKNATSRLLVHAKLMLPADDPVIGIGEFIVALPKSSENAIMAV